MKKNGAGGLFNLVRQATVAGANNMSQSPKKGNNWSGSVTKSDIEMLKIYDPKNQAFGNMDNN